MSDLIEVENENEKNVIVQKTVIKTGNRANHELIILNIITIHFHETFM